MQGTSMEPGEVRNGSVRRRPELGFRAAVREEKERGSGGEERKREEGDFRALSPRPGRHGGGVHPCGIGRRWELHGAASLPPGRR
jgi:hypothetical protein